MNFTHDSKNRFTRFLLGSALGAIAVTMSMGASVAHAQVPKDIEDQLIKIGHIVDPACTAKIYRPLMPKNDFNTYWPPDAPAPVFKGELYPGVTIMRDQSFGSDPKDVVDIFMADKGGENRPVLIYVPGGGGNKIEQQVRESNAFYDNIGRWATENGMVGVTIQRHAHPGGNWDDTGRDIANAVDYIYDNIKKYHGDPNRMIIWAHSAGNGPLSMYVGHPDRWPHGVRVKAAIFNSGNPVANPPGAAPAAPGGGRGGAGGGAGANAPGAFCGITNGMASNDGKISGPSGQATAGGGPGGPGGPGGAPGAGGRGAGAAGGPAGAPGGPGGPGGGRAQLTPEQQAERDNWPGFKASPVKIMLAWGQLDIGVMDDKFPAAVVTLHDDLCMLDGSNAKDGTGHCPKMVMFKGESHMSEVFSPDTNDKTVTTEVLAFIKGVK